MRTAATLGLMVLALVPGACGKPPDVDGARAHARVVRQVEFGPRVPGSEGHRAMRAWLEGELGRLGASVQVQSFVETEGGPPVELHNVIARYGPATGRRLALGAHYDTRAWSDQDPDTSQRRVPVPGANDGGSGVAVLLEVAEVLSRTKPPCGVDLLFFDGEDQGDPSGSPRYSRGARGYAQRLPARGDDRRPLAAFVFDMVGDRELRIPVERQSSERAANLVGLVLEGARRTGGRHFDPEVGSTVFDDHVPLLEAGVPAVDVIDFEYGAWHTPADLPDRVSPESLAEVARVAVWLVLKSPLATARLP